MIAANKIVRGCVRCDECGDCYTHTLYDLRELMLAIKYEIAMHGKQVAQVVNFGYGKVCLSDNDIQKLLIYKRSIRRFYDNMRQKAMACLCDIEFQKIKEKVLRIIKLQQCKAAKVTDITYDYSGYDQWVAQHPRCVAYDIWEKGIIKCEPVFTISAKLVERVKVTRTLHALAKRDTSDCVTKLLAYAYKAKCENKISISSKTEAKCKIELTVLAKKHKCNLSLAVYSKLISCNLSFNVVSTILGCGGKFSLDKAGTPLLKIGAKSAKVEDVVKLAGGTWPDVNSYEFNQIYG